MHRLEDHIHGTKERIPQLATLLLLALVELSLPLSPSHRHCHCLYHCHSHVHAVDRAHEETDSRQQRGSTCLTAAREGAEGARYSPNYKRRQIRLRGGGGGHFGPHLKHEISPPESFHTKIPPPCTTHI